MRNIYLFLLINLILNFFISFPAFAEKRIAILPFEVLTKEKNMEQFGVGTMDSINNALSTVPGIVMIERGQISSVMKEIAFQQSGFSDSKTSAKLGKILNAEILILGSIQTFNNNFKISAHFTEVETGKIIGAIELKGEDIFELQEQLAAKLLEQNNIITDYQQKEHITKVIKSTRNFQAYDYYIKGRTAYLKFDTKGFEEAVNYFNEALKVDSNYNLALAARAEALALWAFSLMQNKESYYDLLKLEYAEVDAKKALNKNPQLSESHRALAIIYNIKKRYKEGEAEANKAITLNPNDAEAYFILWANLENDDIKNPAIHKALKLNPYLIIARTTLGQSYYYRNMIEEAISEFKQSIKINPDYVDAHSNLGEVLFSIKKYNEAIPELIKTIELDPNFSYSYFFLGSCYLEIGKIDEAIKFLNKFIELKPLDGEGYRILGYAYNSKGLSIDAGFYFKKGCDLGSKESCSEIDNDDSEVIEPNDE